MNDPNLLRSTRSRRARRAAIPVVLLLLVGIVWTVGPSRLWFGRHKSGSAGSRAPARNVYADSSYLNARPGIAYVGDAACARCHREIAEDYSSHPMGRSLAPIGSPDKGPPTGTATEVAFESRGIWYSVEHRAGHVFHKAMRRDADGAFAETRAEVRFTLGSGEQGVNFLIERDGFLFQSPIAWFAQQSHWGISPGYEDTTKPPNFERVIHADCLFCHTNRVRAVSGSLNRYQPPIFEGHAIGCERCHGPGELHVKQDAPSAESDSTIVNPADLAPALRDSVCQQCHLQASYRTTRAGRESFDYRPGLPLHRFWAVFQRYSGNRDQFEAVGQVEQIESSRCFRESRGELGCISCHDPHRRPDPATKVAYYRDRCLECHQRRGCALPSAVRQARGPGEDCIACHMPRLAIQNVPHTAATNHRILRGNPGLTTELSRVAPGQPGKILMRDYHSRLMTEDERLDAMRDLGVALAWLAQRLEATPQLAKIAATQAIPSLEVTVRDHPDDLPAGQSLGAALEILGRGDEALRAFNGVLRLNPRHELTLRSSGRLLARLHQLDQARAALERTIAVNPWRSDYRLALAKVCSQAGDWRGAATACQEAIRLDPELNEARSLIIEYYLRLNDRQKADFEFQTLIRFYPASREMWQNWYEGQKYAGQQGKDSAANVGR